MEASASAAASGFIWSMKGQSAEAGADCGDRTGRDVEKVAACRLFGVRVRLSHVQFLGIISRKRARPSRPRDNDEACPPGRRTGPFVALLTGVVQHG